MRAFFDRWCGFVQHSVQNPKVSLAKVAGLILRGGYLQDKIYLRLIYAASLGTRLNLKTPTTFNEKLQWLKLYDRNPLYCKLVDKYEVKKWVADKIGTEHVVPTLGVWDSFDEIDYCSLPEQFVLKCTHDSGGLVICRDKESLDKATARAKIERSLKKNYFYSGREWPYKNVKPRILAEKFLESLDQQEPIDSDSGGLESDVPADYKFFCFDGKVKALFVATGRGSGDVRFDFFDTNFDHFPFTNGHPHADSVPAKPKGFEKMVELAEKLSDEMPHVRVDFYEVGGVVYFGEMTFYHFSGLVPFEPATYDDQFGNWLNLPRIQR